MYSLGFQLEDNYRSKEWKSTASSEIMKRYRSAEFIERNTLMALTALACK